MRTVNFLMSGLFVFNYARAIVHVQLMWLNDLMCVLFVACGSILFSMCFIFLHWPHVYAMVNYSAVPNDRKCSIRRRVFFSQDCACFKLELYVCIAEQFKCKLEKNSIVFFSSFISRECYSNKILERKKKQEFATATVIEH